MMTSLDLDAGNFLFGEKTLCLMHLSDIAIRQTQSVIKEVCKRGIMGLFSKISLQNQHLHTAVIAALFRKKTPKWKCILYLPYGSILDRIMVGVTF